MMMMMMFAELASTGKRRRNVAKLSVSYARRMQLCSTLVCCIKNCSEEEQIKFRQNMADLLEISGLHPNTLEKARYHQRNPATRSPVYQPTDKIQVLVIFQ